MIVAAFVVPAAIDWLPVFTKDLGNTGGTFPSLLLESFLHGLEEGHQPILDVAHGLDGTDKVHNLVSFSAAAVDV